MRRGAALLLLAVAKDGFEGYKSEEFPLYGGWVTSQELLAEDAALPIVDKYEYASGMQSLRLKSGDGGAALMVKKFALPERFPFDTSDGTFAIANEVKLAVKGITPAESLKKTSGARAGDRERVREERQGRRQKAAKSASSEESTTFKLKSAQSPKAQAGSGTDATTRILSASTNGGSFYIYSITGVLLAEYSRQNQPVKDYIYVGGRLLAEYKPQEIRTYFYTPDQINSTRIVTNASGTVVYSAAHDPYGGIQQSWVNTYDPTPKFSGKERDSESGLDYFGARYYDKSQYRFISVDPLVDGRRVISNPQLSNLYTFCRNNPANYLDPDGKQDKTIRVVRDVVKDNFTMGRLYLGNQLIGYTLEHPYRDNHPWTGDLATVSCIPADTYKIEVVYWKREGKPSKFVSHLIGVPKRSGVLAHNGQTVADTHGCPLVATGRLINRGKLAGQGLDQVLVNYYLFWKLYDFFYEIITGEPPKGKVTWEITYTESVLRQTAQGLVDEIRN